MLVEAEKKTYNVILIFVWHNHYIRSPMIGQCVGYLSDEDDFM